MLAFSHWWFLVLSTFPFRILTTHCLGSLAGIMIIFLQVYLACHIFSPMVLSVLGPDIVIVIEPSGHRVVIVTVIIIINNNNIINKAVSFKRETIAMVVWALLSRFIWPPSAVPDLWLQRLLNFRKCRSWQLETPMSRVGGNRIEEF